MPSLTDTFGIVIIEGLQCGTPVAAYPVTGPKDILERLNDKNSRFKSSRSRSFKIK